MSDAASHSPKVTPPKQPPTGLRDLYPSDLNRLRFIQQAWRETSIAHGFDEIDGPTFEDADLYAVKSGEGILNEVFGVFSGKNPEERARLAAGGNAPFALRPEFTPTLARMYAARAGALPKPTKWFWTQNCFRAERPQRGRLREFYQWNCDIIGLEASDKEREPLAQARADAECIATCVGLLEALGLTPKDVRVKISNRALWYIDMEHRGIPAEVWLPALEWIDGWKKRGDKEHLAEAHKLGIAREHALGVAAILGVALDPSEATRAAQELESTGRADLAEQAKAEAHEALRTKGAAAMTQRVLIETLLSEMDLLSWVDWDLSIVRGLAYYTGMVFEVHEASGAERAIAGGGRYDNLIELFGGPPTPAVGFGMGDVVLSLVLQDKGLMPSDDQIAARLGLRPDAFVISSGAPEADAQIAPTLAALRQGSPSQRPLHARRTYKSTKNVGKLIQDAAKSRAKFCVIIENATHCKIKNLDTQQESDLVPLADIRKHIAT